jgi:acetylornithine deacetylase/succinyl-diaminopimelate desuccinylase-like protein
VSFVLFLCVLVADGVAQDSEATALLKQYVAIDTSNPPGDTRKAADFLAGILEREGIPVTRYESAPGKAIVYGRLEATVSPPAGKAIVLLHHMDVVPADRAQWKTDPFTPTIQGNELWGRGSMDMKGQGVAQLLAFLRLKRERVPLNRDVIVLAEPDEEVGGALGARWMIANHYSELDPEYVIDEGGFGSRDLFAAGKLVYGISVAEKKIVWLKLRAEGVAGHGSQPTNQNPNDRLVKALARLLAAEPATQSRTETPVARRKEPTVIDVMQAKVGPLAANKFTNAIQKSTISLTWPHLAARRRRRAAEDQRHPVGGRGGPRLPRAARCIEGSVDRRSGAAPRRRVDQDRADQRVGRSGGD